MPKYFEGGPGMKASVGVWGIWNDHGERWVQVHGLGPYSHLNAKQTLALKCALEAALLWVVVPPVHERKPDAVKAVPA